MKITEIRTHFVDRYLFVTVHTDAGLVGVGESGTWGFLEASAQVIETYKRYLIGEDPLRI
ncbi:MAG: galactokinase, partial [Chloroflexota bacterium]|nr:galactokinase [Chloroflexota bacterium]